MAWKTIISNPPDLGQRVEKLEKANRRLKLAGVLVLTLVGCLLLLGVASPKRTVEAETFVIRDANGKPRAVLGMTAGGPALLFIDANGKQRMTLGTPAGEEPVLLFLDANEKERAGLTILAGLSVLTFTDANEKQRVILGISVRGPGLVVRDANGKVVFSAP